jgi:hypothetical protein
MMASQSNLESESLSAMSQAASSIPQLGATPSVAGAGAVRTSAGTDATPVRLGLMEDRLRADFRSAVGTIHRWMEMDSVRIRAFGVQARFIALLALFLVMLPVWFLAITVGGRQFHALSTAESEGHAKMLLGTGSEVVSITGHGTDVNLTAGGNDPTLQGGKRALSQAEISSILVQIETLEHSVKTLSESTERLKRLISVSTNVDSTVPKTSATSDGTRLARFAEPANGVPGPRPIAAAVRGVDETQITKSLQEAGTGFVGGSASPLAGDSTSPD